MLKHFCFPEGLHPVGEEPCQSRGNCEQAGAVERSCSGPITAALGGECGNLEWRGTVQPVREGSKGIVLFVFAPHYLSLIDSK